MTATVASGAADTLRPTPPPGMGRGALLSALAHALLIVALAVGLSWRSHSPQTFSAELWSAVPQAAAPRGEPAPPPPPPPPAARAAPPVPAPAPPKADAQIAIQRAREEAQRERERQAERARIEREKAEKAKAEREKAEREKAERERLEREKAVQLKAERERAERGRAEARERDKQAQARAEEARLARQREENLKRMMGQAGVTGATGAPGATGSAMRDAAPSASYAGRLIARVKPNIVLTAPVPGKPAAEVEVRAAPSGTILSRRLVKSSGNKDWDDAVLRAIDRTGELPRDEDGRVPPVVLITFTP